MMIVFEGVDKVGKSTLIEAFSKKLPCFIIKSRHRPVNSNTTKLDQAYLEMMKFAFGTDDAAIYDPIMATAVKFNIIFDRFFPSQIAYSVLRGHDSGKSEFYKWLEEQILKLPHLYVYCVVDNETLYSRHEVSPDDYIKTDNIRQLQNRYDNFYMNTKMRKITVNTLDTEVAVARILVEVDKIVNGQTELEGWQHG